MSNNDFDFDKPYRPAPKIDFKKVFFNPEQGLNLVRVIASGGKTCKSHFTKDAKGAKRFVKCPGAGCPLCTDGQRPTTRYFVKVVDRKTNLIKVWEFGSQIKTQIDEFVTDIEDRKKNKQAEEGEKLSDYNIEIRRREPGKNPLYMLALRERLVGNDRFAELLKTDEEALATDETNLEDLIKPWPIERIKSQILGIEPDANSSFVGSAPSFEPQPTAVASVQEITAKAVESAGDDSWIEQED